jgi:hypothetical protein
LMSRRTDGVYVLHAALPRLQGMDDGRRGAAAWTRTDGHEACAHYLRSRMAIAAGASVLQVVVGRAGRMRTGSDESMDCAYGVSPLCHFNIRLEV